MKAVILAAGKSTRTYPLTVTKPKPLLKIANKTLIEHNLEQLLNIVDEVIVVIGYKGSQIKQHVGDSFESIKIRYVQQKQQLGTGHALMQVEKYLKGEHFIVMMGDDLYFRSDVRRCARYEYGVLCRRVKNFSSFGVFIEKDNKILDLVEKPQKFVSDLANAAFYVFTDKIFHSLRKIKKSSRGELELTDGLKHLALKEDIFSVEAKVWLPIGYPWNLIEADQIIRDKDLRIGRKSVVRGDVSNSTIGNNCVIEGFVKNSVIGDHVHIHKESVVEDTVMGDGVIFSGTIKAAFSQEITVQKKKLEVENFGAAIGDRAHLRNVLVQPGTFIWPGVHKTGKELKGVVKK